jgi:subtilisin family serine protease
MMDAVFEAQFRLMKEEFARRGIEIEVALRPDGEADYLYQPGRLLALATSENLSLLANALPGLRGVQRDLRPDGELTVITTDALARKEISVPEALDRIDRRLGTANPAFGEGGLPAASPDHVVHVSRICPAVEPEVPSGHPVTPWPAQRPPVKSARQILIGISDTGLLEHLDPARYPWLSDVTGDPDPLAPPPGGGPAQIAEYAAHGTFVAGVAKCEAPQARVLVNNHFTASGGELESVMVDKVLELAQQKPDVINLSAGTYTRNDWASLGFSLFNRRHPEIAFVAAAGNDTTDRPFWPAAFDWAVSVGALATDQQHRAWFSNFGPWVDVYALGEGMVNAYATGEYTYNEPPKAPATQAFDGMARWDGTSFSAPLVAGLIAERMARTTDSATQATAAVLKLASNQVLAGVGPALFPGDAA